MYFLSVFSRISIKISTSMSSFASCRSCFALIPNNNVTFSDGFSSNVFFQSQTFKSKFSSNLSWSSTTYYFWRHVNCKPILIVSSTAPSFATLGQVCLQSSPCSYSLLLQPLAWAILPRPSKPLYIAFNLRCAGSSLSTIIPLFLSPTAPTPCFGNPARTIPSPYIALTLRCAGAAGSSLSTIIHLFVASTALTSCFGKLVWTIPSPYIDVTLCGVKFVYNHSPAPKP